MSRLYVSEYEDNGMKKWGLFYDDERGIQHLSEDFKKVSFDTVIDAKNKLRL